MLGSVLGAGNIMVNKTASLLSAERYKERDKDITPTFTSTYGTSLRGQAPSTLISRVIREAGATLHLPVIEQLA